MSIASLSNKRVTIQRRTLVASESSAAGTVTWTNNATNVKCAIQPTDARDVERFAQTLGKVTHTMFCQPAVSIKSRDRVVLGAITYEVAGPAMDAAGRGNHQEIMLLEREES